MVSERAAGRLHVRRVLRFVEGFFVWWDIFFGDDVVDGLHLLLIFISATDVTISTHDQS